MVSKTPQQESLLIDGPAGQLEALLEWPADSALPADGAVICHPHPLHGGAMQNKVAHTLARAAVDQGYAALRFNFRGVGESAGEFDHGRGERDDALAAVAALRQRCPGRLVVGGFSFGAAVAIDVARTVAPAALVSIAPAVDRWERDDDWVQPDCPWLIVHGDADELVDVDAVIEFVDTLAPGPELLVMNDVTHFFHGHLVTLRNEVGEFLAAAGRQS